MSSALALTEKDRIIGRLETAAAMLAQCRDEVDAKKVADMARAAEVYARRQKLSEEAIAYATAVKVDAMALMGEFLKATEKNKGRQGQLKGRNASGGYQEEPPEDDTPTLGECGITKKESMQAQALASIKEEKPELYEQVRTNKTSIEKARKVAKGTAPTRAKRKANEATKKTIAPDWADYLSQLAAVVEFSKAINPKKIPEESESWQLAKTIETAAKALMAAATRLRTAPQ